MDMGGMHNVEFKQYTLEKFRVAVQHGVELELDRHVDVELYARELSRGLVVQLRTFIWADPDVRRKRDVYRHPRRWVDMFRHKYFYADCWHMRRWPIQWHVHEVICDVQAVYPDYNPIIPDERHYMKFAKFEVGDFTTHFSEEK